MLITDRPVDLYDRNSSRRVAIDLRDESPHDQKAILHVVSCAFGQLAEAQLVEELRDPGDIIVSLVADEDGQVVSHVLLS